MKHLIIILVLAFYSTSALAETDCEFITDNIFTCVYEGNSPLEIFETPETLEITRQSVDEDGNTVLEISSPAIKGFDLNIKTCTVITLEAGAVTTCFLNELGYSTARLTPQTTTIMRPVPQKTVIKRVDRR